MAFKDGDRVRLKKWSGYHWQSEGTDGTVKGRHSSEWFSVHWDNGHRNSYPPDHLVAVTKMVTRLKRLARKFLDKDTQALIEAGYLNENLSVNTSQSEHILLFIVDKYKKELAEEARTLIKERKEREE